MWLLLCAGAAGAAESVSIHGATSVVDLVINPHKAAVEKTTGITLEVLGNNAGRGLIDLDDGKCDISITAADLQGTLAAAKTGGKEVKADGLVVTHITDDELAFVVSKNNPVNSLTSAQLKDLFTGKITNWKSVGGPNMPVVIMTDGITSATRTMIKQKVMKNEAFAPTTRTLSNQNMFNAELVKTPGGLAGMGKGLVTADIKMIQTSEKITRPLAFITKGAPAGKAKKVIDAYLMEVNKGK